MSLLDSIALGVFLLCWLGLEPAMARSFFGHRGIMAEMEGIRAAWMRSLLQRDSFLVDAQIIGHTIHSASFFGSANLLVIVGIGGTLIAGQDRGLDFSTLIPFVAPVPAWVLHLKVGLILAPLLRAVLDFIWAVRQLNYSLAAIASCPPKGQDKDINAWAAALVAVLNPAMRTFSVGVRSYHFSLAAACWLLGPVALILGACGSIAFLYWRQTGSGAALGLHGVRLLLAREIAEIEATKAPKSGA